MNILAVDTGTLTGWALLHDGKITSGTWVLATPKEIAYAHRLRMDRRCDPRFLRLLHNLKCLTATVKLDWCVFEDIEFCKSRMQAHLFATWRAAIWTLANEGVNIDCLATGKLKNFSTGSGAADKSMMAKSLTMDPRYILHPKGVRDLKTGDILDDNAVDALCLLAWAQKTFRD